MSESKNEGECVVCYEETNYAKCSNCKCFYCKTDYDGAAKMAYVAQPAELNRLEGMTDAQWRILQQANDQEIAGLKPLTPRQHLLKKYNSSPLSGGKDERDKNVLISQGLAAMNVAEDTATEQQKNQALKMDDVGVICPCCSIGIMRILKPEGKASGRVTMSIDEILPKQGFARGGIHDDSDDEDELLKQAIRMSLQQEPSRPSGPGAAVRRPQAAAAAPEPEYRDLAAAVSASLQPTVNPIQQIHRQLNQRGIQVSEEYVRRIFQQMSRLYPKHDYRAINETEKYFVDAAARNPPPPSVQTPPPSYDELLRNRELYPQLRARRLLPGQQPGQQQLFQPPPLPPLPPGWELLRNPDGQQFYAGPNGERTSDFPWNAYDAAQRRGGKKSKMTKSRRGKKSKIIKSRKGKKSKMTKSRRGKKSKMTRKKV